jgi:multimeric flavodoxin WrbA
MTLKVLALNSSPLKDRGNTDIILKSFLAGLNEAGAEVQEVYINDLDIKPCLGKLVCWVKTPGVCCQKDDMETLLEKLKNSDVWVFASPVYWDGVTGRMKNMMDRMLPILEAFIELREGHCRHAIRSNIPSGKIVLISTCGFWERDNFEPVIMHMEAVAKNAQCGFAGALVRPHGALIKYLVKTDYDKIKPVLDAAKNAGIELVENGVISNDTMDKVSQELVSRDKYMEMINSNFEGLMEKFQD